MRREECRDYTDAPVVVEGTRNDTLYRLGCALRGQHGKDRAAIVTALVQYNTDKCSPQLDEAEVISIVESVCEHPAEIKTGKSGKRLEDSPLYWFPFNTREWFSNQNVAMMNAEQTGWYIRLLAFAWDQGGFLPADHDKLSKLAKAPRRRFECGCDLVLAEYEQVEVDGDCRLRNPTMAAQYATALETWMKKKEAGDISNQVRLKASQHKRDTQLALAELAEAANIE